MYSELDPMRSDRLDAQKKEEQAGLGCGFWLSLFCAVALPIFFCVVSVKRWDDPAGYTGIEAISGGILILLVVVPILTLPFALAVGGLASLLGKKRDRARDSRDGWVFLVFFIAIIFVLFARADIISSKRETAIPVSIERGGTVIDAIRRHEKDIGVAPKELDELVPKYLEEIPETGVPPHPDFRYWRSKVFHEDEVTSAIWGLEVSFGWAKSLIYESDRSHSLYEMTIREEADGWRLVYID